MNNFNENANVPSVERNFVLFKTDLFLSHVRPYLDPVMEDWGWTFAVSVAGTRVRVNVWWFSDHCWLFGLETKRGWWTSSAAVRAAQDVVAKALEAIMVADPRIQKRRWFTDNPFDLNIKEF